MRKWKNSFAVSSKNDDTFYDLHDDWNLIESSFAQQYGIRLRMEYQTMTWDEFCTLLSGLKPDTPLGNIVSIRSETNRDILKHFTPQQKKIRNEWKKRNATRNVSMDQYDHDMKMFENLFESLAKAGEINGT